MAYKHTELTEAIIGAFYAVYGDLGYGFLEKVYANALALELHARGVIGCRSSRLRAGTKAWWWASTLRTSS